MVSEEHIKTLPPGTAVVKPFGYPFPGIVVAAFYTRDNKRRYVVESTTLPGLLHIFSPQQLEEVP